MFDQANNFFWKDCSRAPSRQHVAVEGSGSAKWPAVCEFGRQVCGNTGQHQLPVFDGTVPGTGLAGGGASDIPPSVTRASVEWSHMIFTCGGC